MTAFIPLRAKGVIDADNNLDCWDTAPFDICYEHVALLNEKDPAAMWRVVDLYALDAVEATSHTDSASGSPSSERPPAK